MKIKEIKWKEVNYYRDNSKHWEGKIGWRIVGKIYRRGATYEWIARLGINNEIGKGISPSIEMAEEAVSQALENGIIKKFFQKD